MNTHRRADQRAIQQKNAPIWGHKDTIGWSAKMLEPELRIPEFRERAFHARMMGKRHAEEMSGADADKAIKLGRVLLAEQLFSGVPHDEHDACAWSHYVAACFWHAASVRSKGLARNRTNPVPAWAHYGYLVQTCLSRTLVGVSQDDCRTLFQDEAFQGQEEFSEWKQCFVGAVSVVRVINALRRQDVTGFLPTLELDLGYKIDLIVRPPAPAKLLCLQVKTARYPSPSSVRFVQTSDVGDDMPTTTLRMGTLRLSRELNAPCVPVMVHVSPVDGQRPWYIEAHGPLRDALSVFTPAR